MIFLAITYSHTTGFTLVSTRTAPHLDIGWPMAQQESWHARPTWRKLQGCEWQEPSGNENTLLYGIGCPFIWVSNSFKFAMDVFEGLWIMSLNNINHWSSTCPECFATLCGRMGKSIACKRNGTVTKFPLVPRITTIPYEPSSVGFGPQVISMGPQPLHQSEAHQAFQGDRPNNNVWFYLLKAYQHHNIINHLLRGWFKLIQSSRHHQHQTETPVSRKAPPRTCSSISKARGEARDLSTNVKHHLIIGC